MRADERIDRLVVAEGDQQVQRVVAEPLGEREVIDGWTGDAAPQRDIRTEIGPSGAVRAFDAPPPIVWGPPPHHATSVEMHNQRL